MNVVIFVVVKALQNVSAVRFYGVTALVDILKGKAKKRIIESGLDKIPEFGSLNNMPYETIQSIIEWMIAEHYILKTKGR